MAILLLGIVVGQFVLYGPSLMGHKILLPLDLLAGPGAYLPETPENQQIMPHDYFLSDQVLQFETERRFSVDEIHAGRWPLWATYQYAGSPIVWPKYSPFILLGCLFKSPIVLAWTQMLAAMVAGTGTFSFCRRVLGVSFWAATVSGWCYPLTGFFVFWQGFPTCGSVYWLPWILLAVRQTMRSPTPLGPLGLGGATCLVLICGTIDVAAQVLIASGLFAVWGLIESRRSGEPYPRTRRALIMLVAGWAMGFLWAAPHLLPLLEYCQTGARVVRRATGKEERPPVGVTALPQIVLPDMYGATRFGSMRIAKDNQIESSASGYAGMLATLLVAPLAWCSRRHRSINLFWALLVFFGLSWCLNVPGMVQVLRMPGLNMMSHNRMVFGFSFAIISLSAVGMDSWRRGAPQRQKWFLVPVVLLAGLLAWCSYRLVFPPEKVATLARRVSEGQYVFQVRNLDDAARVCDWFTAAFVISTVLCVMGLMGWLLVWMRKTVRPCLFPLLALSLVCDLLLFARNRSAQCAPGLYFPRLPVLEAISASAPGRVIGYRCLPATLAQTHSLRDVRGYDSIDPARLIELLDIAGEDYRPKPDYASSQWFSPRVDFSPPSGIRVSPILDMLGVRYVIFRGTPPSGIHPPFQAEDYWALENQAALPRAFIPRRVESWHDATVRLAKLAAPDFDPRAKALVEIPIDFREECRGSVDIISEVPTRLALSVKMDTPGLVVLGDRWDKGWRAYWNGVRVEIIHVNHALQGVILPAQSGTLEFKYQPASLFLGLGLAGLATVAALAGVAIAFRPSRCQHNSSPGDII